MTTQIDELMQFLSGSITPFHAVEVMAKMLQASEFEQLDQFDAVRMTPGKGYFVVHQGSSLMALRAGQGSVETGLRLVGAHTDSPNLSVKPNPVKGRDGCIQLGVDVFEVENDGLVKIQFVYQVVSSVLMFLYFLSQLKDFFLHVVDLILEACDFDDSAKVKVLIVVGIE